ncbi:MAG TPA: hypothetical protein VFS08_08445 [Gemmatimonadaceae bacterium]|nr:hypothetical protein [Gemmatimonadaceae bacterium]
MPVAHARQLASHLTVAALLLAVATTPAAAQASGDVVPRELAVALLGGGPSSGGSGAVQLRVGEAAPGLPATALPHDGLLLGSASYPGRSETVVVLVRRPDEVLAAVEQRLTTAGWTRPPERRDGPFGDQRRGFVSTPVGGQAPGFCHEKNHLVPRVERWSGGRTLLRLHLTRIREYSPCSPPSAMARAFTEADSISPILEPPSGSRVQGMSSGGGGDHRQMQADITTALDVAQLLAHYGAQMAEQGWAKVAEAARPAVGTQLWRRLDAEGQLWFATLTVVDQPNGTGRDASLLLHRDR